MSRLSILQYKLQYSTQTCKPSSERLLHNAIRDAAAGQPDGYFRRKQGMN